MSRTPGMRRNAVITRSSCFLSFTSMVMSTMALSSVRVWSPREFLQGIEIGTGLPAKLIE
jgi:hypothetical protein